MDWSFGNMAPDSHPPETAIVPGVVVGGRYRVRDEVGGGSQGQVFRADDLQLNRPVAIKVLKSRSETTRERFLREGRLTASLAHPNVVRLLAGGLTQDGRPFWVLELLDDPVDFDDYVRDKPLAERLRLFMDVCRGVGAAHTAGIVHRDLKPSNLLVDRHGHVRVVDFGLSVQTHDSLDLTQSNTVVGTPLYMSPEALVDSRLGRRPQQDVWSLGVILYQLLTDELPFSCQTLSELYSQMTSGVRAPSTRARVTPELERVCLRCLRSAPEERYPDAVALAAALQGVSALRPGEAPWTAIGFVVAMALGGLGAWGLLRGSAGSASPDPAPVGPQTPTPPPYVFPDSDAEYLAHLQRALEDADTARLQVLIDAGTERGHPDAHYAKGVVLARGLGVPVDEQGALDAFRLAVRGGSRQAMVALAAALLQGLGGEVRLQDALQLYERAAGLGSAEAHTALGRIYLLGEHGVERNLERAESHLLAAAEVPEAAFLLGKLCYHRKDFAEGDRWIRRSAERGDPQGMYELGVVYLERDQRSEAIEWLRKSAEAGWDQAQVRLASLYLDGELLPQNMALAWEWVERAATHSALGQYNLGVFYERGYGRPADPARARELFLQAAEGGEPTAMAKCFHVLSEGRGGPVNHSAAHRWLRLAAEANYAPAQKLLGKRLMLGETPDSRELDPRERAERALPFLTQAARQEDPEAWYALGFCFMRLGRQTEAVRMMRRASEGGLAAAHTSLGEVLCAPGEAHDPVRALAYFRKALELGQPRGALGVGRVLEGEYGQTPDLVGARAAYEQGAELGSQGCMFRLAKLLATDRGGPPDPERGRALLEQALVREREAEDRDPSFVKAIEDLLETYPELPPQ